MTGPEHYAETEKHLAISKEAWNLAQATAEAENWPAHEAAKWCADYSLARAQVHATLAQVAATVEAGGLTEAGDSGFDIPRYPSWAKAVRP